MDGSFQRSQAGTPVTLRGIGVSPGIGIGPAMVYAGPAAPASTTIATAAAHEPAVERERLCAALAAAAEELRAVAERVAHEIGMGEAGIFEAQALMLEDPTILETAEPLLAGGADASAALTAAAEAQAAELAALPDPLWQARAADVRDAARRALVELQPADERAPTLGQRLTAAPMPVVVVAEDFAPSDTISMRREWVRGIALAGGSATAHAAILARALGIPAVVGLGSVLMEEVREGDELVVDGAEGTVAARPDAASRERAERGAAQHEQRIAAARARVATSRGQPGATRDGLRIPLLANVGTEADARQAAEMGAEGIGLLRTEFLFAGRATLPDDREQADAYAAIVAALGLARGPILVRTLDAGADKPLPALAEYARQLPPEANPALGVRGIRLHAVFPELLATQVRAILLAAARTRADLRVMLPMVAVVEEVRLGRALLEQERRRLQTEGVELAAEPPLGIMVETPAAVLGAATLACEAAFFSIGTNDLTQYVLAADRLNPRLAPLADAAQPAVLRAIAAVTSAAHDAGRHVGVCGEMAGDSRLAALLAGLGVDELSMTPVSIPAVKEALAARTGAELREMAMRALAAATADEVRQVVSETLD